VIRPEQPPESLKLYDILCSFEMRTTSGVTLQERCELLRFVRRIKDQQSTTGEFKSVLMILRQHSSDPILRDWAHTVAHSSRDQGNAFEAAINLWIERFEIAAYFSKRPSVEKIPFRVFETIRSLIDAGEVPFYSDRRYPKYSKDEVVASLDFMYRKAQDGRNYELRVSTDYDSHDLNVVQRVADLLESTPWGGLPYTFQSICDALSIALSQFAGTSRADISAHCDFLALHFLSAFHLTELKISRLGNSDTKCYLAVDSTLSGHLSLNIGLYSNENGLWDQLQLQHGCGPAHLIGSHCFSRPFLVTQLKESQFSDISLQHDGVRGAWFRHPLIVKHGGGRSVLAIPQLQFKSQQKFGPKCL
jgi:hypothetical protein